MDDSTTTSSFILILVITITTIDDKIDLADVRRSNAGPFHPIIFVFRVFRFLTMRSSYVICKSDSGIARLSMFASLTRYASSSCPFQVLGLKNRSVDPITYEQVRAAFRELAFKHHPDTSSSRSDNSEKDFIRIKAAFEAIEEDDTGMAVVRGNRPYMEDDHETSANRNEKKKYSPSSQDEQFLHSSLDPQILRELHDVANKLNPGGLDKGGFWAYANMIGRMSLTDLPPLRVDSGNDASTDDKGTDKVKTRRKKK
jgi:hypothetical protein